MTEEEPTELMILMRVVEVLDRRMSRSEPSNYPSSISGPNVVVLGDQYTTGHAGSVGPNSSADDISFIEIFGQAGSTIDLPSLALELMKLRAQMKEVSRGDLEQDLAIAEVAHAEIYARKNDGASVMKHLHAAGAWALDVAKTASAEIVVAAMKAAMHLR